MPSSVEVDYVSGKTRIFGIVGHPIEQVRSPEMITAEFRRRGRNSLLIPIHVLPDDFEQVIPSLLKIPNLGGLVFTIPFKQAALAFGGRIGPQATVVGAINALARDGEGWKADIFDGTGCVRGFHNRGLTFAGKSVMLIGAGGAGTAIGVAVACEGPRRMRLFDPDSARVEWLATRIREIAPDVAVEIGEPDIGGCDVLLNASPVGMLADSRLPITVNELPSALVVFDAIVMPEETPLLALARRSGCTVVRGREMMLGQIQAIADFFGETAAGFSQELQNA